MIETRQRKEFLLDFTEELEEKAIESGSYQVPFLEKMISFMDRPDEPEILLPPFRDSGKNIAVNAYSYDEENQVLDVYVVDYNFEQNEKDLLSINMTAVTEVANRVKRFITNSKSLLQTIDHSLEAYDLAKIINEVMNSLNEINIFVITNMYYTSNKPVEITIPGIETVNVQVWDIDRVQQLITSEQAIETDYIDFEQDYGETFEMMFVPDPSSGVKDFECYIGYISAELLAKAYDEWGQKLVERNVRSFLQARGGTNKGIRDTLKDPFQRKMFVAYNNGISTVARTGNFEPVKEGVNQFKIKGLSGWQIVNGGQTTASIHKAYKDGISLKDVYVQAKLTILQVNEFTEKDQHQIEDEMISRISQYANTQNKINKSDLLANTRFMSDLEKFSRNIWIPGIDGRRSESKWYFERARGQYMVDINRRKRGKEQTDFKKQYPKNKVLTKVDMAKYFMSWEGYPHVSSKGGEEAFKKFMELNKSFWSGNTLDKITLSVYQKLIARAIINLRVKKIVDEMKLRGYKANVLYYTTAMFHQIYSEQIDLIKVWEEQSLSEKWDDIIRIIAEKTLSYLRESAGERNVTQWAKQEACWIQYKETCSQELKNLI
ncbi:AIPR family protein [Bacillus altitudinis]|uniref:AIPR family protein n=1 Tax=Bacillus TaxID=1386 RepID=UPI0002EBB477|nr:AIPR family protein [Bacillus altitudinis]ATP95981.1 AIPR protein [Bacillus altitudinis]KAJ0071205.1 AIPR family protein [Bacillus altitudinis]MCM3229190.1 AIPR family protein [Bacillus altitudinis]MCY7718670.1 AIPR family protein [Bacillus altitudinis]MDT1121717.1 AIPR family protein [Bacillus altitudinis]